LRYSSENLFLNDRYVSAIVTLRGMLGTQLLKIWTKMSNSESS
jgi:hypothetical protein